MSVVICVLCSLHKSWGENEELLQAGMDLHGVAILMTLAKPARAQVPADGSQKFLQTCVVRSGNPHYLPEVTAKALVVDFGVRQPGLEAQLLDTIVRHERPDLDQQKGELVVKVAQGKQTQVGCRELRSLDMS